MSWINDVCIGSIDPVGAGQIGKKQARADFRRDLLAFSDLPGTHLSWRRIGWGKRDLIADDGHTWATMKYRAHRPTSIEDGWSTYEIEVLQPRQRGLQWVDESRNCIAVVTGSHSNGRASTTMTLAGVGSLSFPAEGRWNGALMSALDDSGHTLIRYRLNPTRSLLFGIPWNLRRVEAVVDPAAHSVPWIAFLVASTCSLLLRFTQDK